MKQYAEVYKLKNVVSCVKTCPTINKSIRIVKIFEFFFKFLSVLVYSTKSGRGCKRAAYILNYF